MKLWDALLDALLSLRRNTLRSVLTTLGIIIGVGAVIIMVAVGNGARVKVDQLIESLGANVMMVIPGSSRHGGVRGGAGSMLSLTEEDAVAIQTELDDVPVAAPFTRGGVRLVAGNLNWGTTAYGITNDYLSAREWGLKTGRLFGASETRSASKVVVLGQTVADNLFVGRDPIGQTIRVNRVPFLVIGVLDVKGQTPFGHDQDDVVMIPLTTAKKRVLGGRRISGRLVHAIAVKARSSELVSEVEASVKTLLRRRHQIVPGKEDDFRVRNLAEMLNAQADSSQALGFLLMAVASISLVVGGIGIMNIMLVSVTERTREIGLRMAVGATGRDILSQFLIESVVLSLMGGLLGVLLGVGGAMGMAELSQWPTVVDPRSVLVAFGFSAVVGVFFGFYPARKAAALNPIDALRYE